MKLMMLTFASVLLATAVPSVADHGWGPPPNYYHWARMDAPLQLQVTDSVSSLWDTELAEVLAKWNDSGVMINAVTASDDAKKHVADANRFPAKFVFVTNRMAITDGLDWHQSTSKMSMVIVTSFVGPRR